MSKKFDACEHCCSWTHDMSGREPSEVRDTYPKMMRKVLRHLFHMPKRAANEFIENACSGNWKRMHLTGAEAYLSPAQWSEHLINEVRYFSDRWSWDRVIRAQWIYQRLRDTTELPY